jgi:hypothetical protein
MVTDEPVLDGRNREQILAWMKSIAPYYVDDWDPDRDDAGTVLFEIFADISEDVIERLDRVPEKQQAVFLNALDFDAQPPQPAKLPVTFEVDDGLGENIPIPTGTTVTAPGTDDRPEQRFETVGDRAFEATPARITNVVAVDPGTDRIVDHTDVLDSDEQVRLFTGDSEQTHHLYLGHTELLNLNPGARIGVEITTNAPEDVFRDYLEWEYYGEDEAGTEGWHSLDVLGSQEPTVASVSEFQQVETFLDRLEEFLGLQGYVRVQTQRTEELLIRSLADDVRKGRFGNPNEADASPALPPNLLDADGIDAGLRTRLQRQLTSLQSRLTSPSSQYGRSVAPVELTLDVPGEIAEWEIDGTESRWIRCRLPEAELTHELFEVLVEDVRLSVGSGDAATGDALDLDDAIANDIALDISGTEPVHLLGDNPTEASTVALACEEALTKPGALVELQFESDESVERPDNDADPELLWEYWNGNGWRRLAVEDGTDALQTDGTVAFEVPADIAETTVMGHDRHWIRTRLVGGNYGELRIEETSENNWERVRDHISPPTYTDVRVDYTQSSVPFRHQLTWNNRSHEDVSTETEGFRPFEAPPGESQAVYFGFDAPLRNGPINLYFLIAGAVYPHDFNPWTDVEYCEDPRTDTWTRLDLRDGTEDLTERGIMSFSLPAETAAFELFGQTRHWIRVRVTGDEFTRTEGTVFVLGEEHQPKTSLRELSTETIAARDRSERTRTPPVVEGIYRNTTWAKNVESIDDEILGSSTGTANQTLQFRNAPVLEATIWVDEIAALSQRERRSLEADETTEVRRETNDDGSVSAFWVRWHGVSDFLRSAPSARHYVLDRTNGTVAFGDGRRGAIPPAAEHNVRATYRTGGGEDGNVAAGAIQTLEDDVAFVENVSNPTAGETGEDEESIREFVSRAPKRLRDRDKPITRDGFERVARSATREIGKVRCKGGFDETGAIGHVTVLVVPDVPQRKPVPSEELLDLVETEMRENAPEAVVSEERNLTVRGPNYLEVSVTATVETDGVQSVTRVQEAAKTALRTFTHPLTGGPDGDGWEIGTAPPPTQFTNRLERLDSVSRVKGITVSYEEGDNEVTLAGGADAPIVPPDVLIYSGQHTVDVEVGDE